MKNAVYENRQSARMMAVYKKINGNDVSVLVFVGEHESNKFNIGLDVVEVKSMEMGLVGIDVDGLQKQLDANGKVPLYGIRFEVDKANLLDGSKKEIEVLAKLLNKNKKMRIYIVGHTDDTGSPEHNLNLSNQRAQSVVKRL